MKQLLCIFFSLCMLSCKKPKETPDPVLSNSGYIQYKLNGSQVTMDNINLQKGEKVILAKQLQSFALPATRYMLNAQKAPSNFLSISLVTDSLRETSYHYDSVFVNNNFAIFTFDLDNNGEMISLYFSSDKLDINISSYKNAAITGTFSGRMSVVSGSLNDYSSRGSIAITDGVFNNVPVTY